MENWKKYRDTIYEVSDLGNVRNIKTKKALSQFKKNNGKYNNDYVRVGIKIEGKKRNVSVHRMVAECFLDNFKEELEVNHKNSIRYDNRLSNLEMATREENYQHSIKKGNGSQRKPVYAIDKEGNKLEFISLWAAARFISDKHNKNIEIDHICTNIKQNLKRICKSAYGYVWYNV